MSLEKLFDVIHKQTGYSFVYEEKTLAVAKAVDVNVKKMTLAQVLGQSLQGQGLRYEIRYNTIIITEEKESKQAVEAFYKPPRTIRGHMQKLK